MNQPSIANFLKRTWLAIFATVSFSFSVATAQSVADAESTANAGGSIAEATSTSIAAVVNDQAISFDVVHHFLNRSLRNLPEAAKREDRTPDMIRTGIEFCINREVILQHLQSGKHKTSENEIDRQLEELSKQLANTGQNLADHLTDMKISETEFRRERLWQTSWRKYAKTFITVEHLQKQFQTKRKYFDGTKMHVSQILLKDKSPNAQTMAQEIVGKLRAKEVTWNEAVQAHSESASAANNGDLGWIKYAGPMPRTFTKQAFELSAGEFSDPFQSRYGIHIIRCTEVAKGTKQFEDVVEQIREIETNRLFQLVAKRHRAGANIENPTEFSDEKK